MVVRLPQLSEDEDLIVWMRTAALPTFRKLYGRIEQDLAANTQLNVVINNVYNTYSFGGKKKLVPNFSTKKKGFTKKSSTLQYVSPINWKPKSALHSNHHT